MCPFTKRFNCDTYPERPRRAKSSLGAAAIPFPLPFVIVTPSSDLENDDTGRTLTTVYSSFTNPPPDEIEDRALQQHELNLQSQQDAEGRMTDFSEDELPDTEDVTESDDDQKWDAGKEASRAFDDNACVILYVIFVCFSCSHPFTR